MTLDHTGTLGSPFGTDAWSFQANQRYVAAHDFADVTDAKENADYSDERTLIAPLVPEACNVVHALETGSFTDVPVQMNVTVSIDGKLNLFVVQPNPIPTTWSFEWAGPPPGCARTDTGTGGVSGGFLASHGAYDQNVSRIEESFHPDNGGPSGVGCTNDGNPSNVQCSDITVTVDISRGPQPGRIIVEKSTTPSGAAQFFGFTGELVGAIKDGQSLEKEVDPGTYTVTELPTLEWALGSITCNDSDSTGNTATHTATFVVAAGETVKCTFLNGAVEEEADLAIEKSATPDPANLNAFITYALNVTNLGPDAAEEVVATDVLPEEVAFVSATASAGSCALNRATVTCALGTLAPSAHAEVTLVVRTGMTAGPVTNVGLVASRTHDANSANNRAEATVEVRDRICERSSVIAKAQFPVLAEDVMALTTDFTWCHGGGEPVQILPGSASNFAETPINFTSVFLSAFGVEFRGDRGASVLVSDHTITSQRTFTLCVNWLTLFATVGGPSTITSRAWLRLSLQARKAIIENIAQTYFRRLTGALAQSGGSTALAQALVELNSHLFDAATEQLLEGDFTTTCLPVWSPSIFIVLTDEGSILASFLRSEAIWFAYIVETSGVTWTR